MTPSTNNTAISLALALGFIVLATANGVAGVADFDICSRPNNGTRNRLVDAITTVANGSTYAFVGQHYWMLGDGNIEPSYPRLISDDWKGLPSTGLDTAVTWQNKIYFFKDGMYWRFSNGTLENNGSVPMYVEFPGIPTPIDAAFVWSGNDQLYFVKGNHYWRFDNSTLLNNSSASSYPKSVSAGWYGVQEPIDAVVKWSNNKTYFLSGSSYWRYNDAQNRFDSDYPKSTRKEWFGCAPPEQSVIKNEPVVRDLVDSNNTRAEASVNYGCKMMQHNNIAVGVDHGFVRNVSSADDCCRICQMVAQTGCKAFVWNADGQSPGDQQTCWLKRIVEPLTEDARTGSVVGFV